MKTERLGDRLRRLRLNRGLRADPNIVQTLVLASIVLAVLSQPLTFTLVLLHQKENDQIQFSSLQRAGIVIIQVSGELRKFSLSKEHAAMRSLKEKLKLFAEDLLDPNRNRETSMQRVFRAAGLMA